MNSFKIQHPSASARALRPGGAQAELQVQKAKEKEAREEAMRRRREEAKAREVRPRRPWADGAAIVLRPGQGPPSATPRVSRTRVAARVVTRRRV